MVSPAAAELEIPGRVTFKAKPKAPHQTTRRHVSRLDIGLEAVEVELAEGVVEHEAKGLAHVSLAGEGGADVIAEVGALERATGDLAELDRADHGVVYVAPDEEPNEGGRPGPSEVTPELGGRLRGSDPRVVERPAPPIQRDQLPLIRPAWEGEMDPGTSPRGRGHLNRRHLDKSEYS
jgi:hypothetical protein